MPIPKLELKNIKTFRGHEGVGLNADIYVNGKKVAFVMDEANGGGYHYEVNHGKSDKERRENSAVLQMVENYARTLPKRPLDMGGGRVADYQPDLDTLIDDLFNAKEKEKTDKKIQKKMENHIMWGVPNSPSYAYVKFSQPLASYSRARLQMHIDAYKKRLKRGEVFLNTNLVELGMTI